MFLITNTQTEVVVGPERERNSNPSLLQTQTVNMNGDGAAVFPLDAVTGALAAAENVGFMVLIHRAAGSEARLGSAPRNGL